MTQQLSAIFEELGILQYLDAFVEEGFDCWETVLDITEADLDALGVKLGHRRKLQRRISHSKCTCPDGCQRSPSSQEVEDARRETPKLSSLKFDARHGNTPSLTLKRKYCRHPKPDENAPERPSSAYVLFSNKVREDLKGQNLTFAEIAKIVGEHWQNISPAEKKPYETQARKTKEQYQQNLAEYKKTPEYQKHLAYLREFHAKNARHSPGATFEQESPKRVKLSDSSSNSGGFVAEAASTRSQAGSLGGGSGTNRAFDATPPSCRSRAGSILPTTDSGNSTSPTPASQHVFRMGDLPPALDELAAKGVARTMTLSGHGASPDPRHSPRRPLAAPQTNWLREPHHESSPGLKSGLPSLSDMLDSRSSLDANFPLSRPRSPEDSTLLQSTYRT